DEWNELPLVAGERARHEACPELDRHLAQVDRIERIGLALLRWRGFVVGRRELTLGQSVAAIVHDDVDHVQPPPNGMRELAETDRGRITITRYADVDEVAIGKVGSRRHRRHAP